MKKWSSGAFFLLTITSFFAQSGPPTTAKQVCRFIQTITTGWTYTPLRMAKAETQKEVFFSDLSGSNNTQAFFNAVKDINAIFGYEKIVGTLSTSSSINEGEIGVYLMPYLKSQRLLRDLHATNNSFKNQWTSRVWFDNSMQISRSVVIIASDRVRPDTLPFFFHRAILCALGYPGWTTDFTDSIFYSGAPSEKTRPESEAFMNELDRAVLQFCDRHVAADYSRSDIQKAFISKWTEFASSYQPRKVAATPAPAP